MSFSPTIHLLGIILKELDTSYYSNTNITIFVAVFFTVVQSRKKSIFPLTDDLVNKMGL